MERTYITPLTLDDALQAGRQERSRAAWAAIGHLKSYFAEFGTRLHRRRGYRPAVRRAA